MAFLEEPALIKNYCRKDIDRGPAFINKETSTHICQIEKNN